jgi:transposase-like protein/anti-sigma regulatory factor (Ser/Thr protein kinase)
MVKDHSDEHETSRKQMAPGFLEIGAVARELGVAPSTLRTWERRYSLVVPRRGDHGQRLYDSDQIVVLRGILAQVRRGARARTAHDLAVLPRPTRTSLVQLVPSEHAPLHARRAVDELVEGHDDARFAFYLRLVASELVKNAVLYGSPRDPIRMEAKLFPGWVELHVQNGGGRLSMKNLRTRRRDGGRGLEIVDALAEAWSIDTGPLGTKITVRLPVEAGA